jgi:hypothetical protein
MARNDRSRFEVFPVEGGFKLQRYDKFGRKKASTDKVFSRRNNARRDAIRICRKEGVTVPILSVTKAFERKAEKVAKPRPKANVLRGQRTPFGTEPASEAAAG